MVRYLFYTIGDLTYQSALVSSLSVSPVSWWKECSSCWKPFCHDNPVFEFTFTSCMSYLTEQAVKLFHIHQLLLLTYHNLCWGWRSWKPLYLSFSHIRFHSTVSSNPNSLFHVLFYRFFFSQKQKVICKFYSANYLCFHSKASKHFNSLLGKVITLKVE